MVMLLQIPGAGDWVAPETVTAVSVQKAYHHTLLKTDFPSRMVVRCGANLHAVDCPSDEAAEKLRDEVAEMINSAILKNRGSSDPELNQE